MRVPFGIIYLTARYENDVAVKYYVGLHRIKDGVVDDGYLGSGTLFKRALRKYGRSCFKRETLELCYSNNELLEAEKKWILFYSADQSKNFYNSILGFADRFPKKVYQYLLSGEYVKSFSSLAKAAKEHPCGFGTISTACQGYGRTAAGYQWRFDKFKRLPEVEYGNKRSVSCYDLEGNFITTFPGAKEAAEYCNRSGANICAACNGRRKEVGGFQWKYSDSSKIITKKRLQNKDTRGYYQIDPKTGEKMQYFPSSTLAAKALGVREGSLSGASKNGYLCGGFLWQHEDQKINPKIIREKERTVCSAILAYTMKGKFIARFDNTTQAAIHFNIRRKRITVSACPTNAVRAACGYQFRYEGSDYPVTDLTVSVPGQRKSIVKPHHSFSLL